MASDKFADRWKCPIPQKNSWLFRDVGLPVQNRQANPPSPLYRPHIKPQISKYDNFWFIYHKDIRGEFLPSNQPSQIFLEVFGTRTLTILSKNTQPSEK